MKIVKRIVIATVIFGFAFAMLQSAVETSGKDIFLNNKCNVCHGISSLEITGKPNYPDLSEFGKKEVTLEFVKKFLNKEEKQNGKAHPVKFKGSDEELTVLVTWLQTLK